MNSLVTTLVVQFILWILLFLMICYLVKKNKDLKRKIEILKNTLDKKGNEN